MHDVGVEIHIHLVTLQIHVLVLHLGITVEVSRSCIGIVGHGVLGRVFHRGIDTVLTLTVQTVQAQGVVDGLVALVNQELQGVHLQGIDNQGRSNGVSVGRHIDHTLLVITETHGRHFRHHKNEDEKQDKYERFSSHGCKGTKKFRV